MAEILLQKLTSNGTTSKLHTAPSFQKLINETEDYLEKIKQSIISSRIDNESMPYCMYLKERLEKYVMVPVYMGPFDQRMSDLCLEAIDQLLAHNAEIASAFTHGIEEADVIIAHGKHVYIGKERGKELDGIISKYTLMRPSTCANCGASVIADALEDHMKKADCKLTALNKYVQAQGLCQISMDIEDQLVRTTNIPYEYHPANFNLYVPAWVQSAIKAYDSMRSRGGFQEMSLMEYLNSIAEVKDE